MRSKSDLRWDETIECDQNDKNACLLFGSKFIRGDQNDKNVCFLLG